MPLIILGNTVYDVTAKQLKEINNRKSKIAFRSGGYLGVSASFDGLDDFKQWLYSQSYKTVGKVSFNDLEF